MKQLKCCAVCFCFCFSVDACAAVANMLMWCVCVYECVIRLWIYIFTISTAIFNTWSLLYCYFVYCTKLYCALCVFVLHLWWSLSNPYLRSLPVHDSLSHTHSHTHTRSVVHSSIHPRGCLAVWDETCMLCVRVRVCMCVCIIFFFFYIICIIIFSIPYFTFRIIHPCVSLSNYFDGFFILHFSIFLFKLYFTVRRAHTSTHAQTFAYTYVSLSPVSFVFTLSLFAPILLHFESPASPTIVSVGACVC